MFETNDRHRQQHLFSDLQHLSAKQQQRLEESWAGAFYRDFFCRLDENPFAVLYSDVASRPNVPVNVLLGLEVLKAGFNWTDEELYDHFCFDVQVRYALGYHNLGEGAFTLRTLYNFRRRVAEHMQQTGKNLIAAAFEQVADAQIAAYGLKTDKVRMDSTQIASNICQTSRLQLLVEVLQRVERILEESDQEHYAEAFAPYVQGSSGQYLYRMKGEDRESHLARTGYLMAQLVDELAIRYEEDPAYQVLVRVFNEHFLVQTGEDETLRPKASTELSADSLQSPDDWEASFRRKAGEDHVGYVTNLSETCHPNNEMQLLLKVQTAPNTTDDADFLVEALPDLTVRTAVNEMYTDGGYNGPDVDIAMQQAQVKQVQTAIRGGQSQGEGPHLADFIWHVDEEGVPQSVSCPHGQTVLAQPGRKTGRFIAHFAQERCATCPFRDTCPTQPLKRKPCRALYVSQQQVNVARRRQRCAQVQNDNQNLRAAIEATVGAVKRPFSNGKVPVRGQVRVSMMMAAAAIMNNVRRICRYWLTQAEETEEQKGEEEQTILSGRLQALFRHFGKRTLWQMAKCLFLGQQAPCLS